MPFSLGLQDLNTFGLDGQVLIKQIIFASIVVLALPEEGLGVLTGNTSYTFCLRCASQGSAFSIWNK